jgi:hypothetical protein
MCLCKKVFVLLLNMSDKIIRQMIFTIFIGVLYERQKS